MLMHVKFRVELHQMIWTFNKVVHIFMMSWIASMILWTFNWPNAIETSQAAMWVPFSWFLFLFLSSPDSDDTYAEESEDCSMRDDQYLVSDKLEGKFYGSVHGTGPSGGTSSNPLNIGPSLEQIQRKIHVSFELLSGFFFVSTFHAPTP